MSQIEKYADEIPSELKKGITGLDHKVRQAIIVLLIHNHSLSFTELAKMLGLSKGKLSHHLSKLQNSALVRNYSKVDFAGPYDSYYSLSRFGESLVDSLTKSVQPSSPEPLGRVPCLSMQNTLANPSLQIEQTIDELSTAYNQWRLNYSNLRTLFSICEYHPTAPGAYLEQFKSFIASRSHDYQVVYEDLLKEHETLTPIQVPIATAPDQRTAAATR